MQSVVLGLLLCQESLSQSLELSLGWLRILECLRLAMEQGRPVMICWVMLFHL